MYIGGVDAKGYHHLLWEVVDNSGGKAKGTGTEMFFHPDPEIFGPKLHFDADLIREVLEAKTYLHKGLKVLFKDETSGKIHEFSHEGGITDYLSKIVADRGKPA